MPKKIKDFQQLLFLTILAIIPFNIRHVLNYETIKDLEGFREHLSLSVYAFDFLLLCLLLLQLPFLLRSMLRNKDSSFFVLLKETFNKLLRKPLLWFLVVILLSISFSTYAGISLYNGVRLLEAVIFFIIASNFFASSKTTKAWSILILFLGGVFQSLIAILQFSLQSSLGLKFLGESVFSPELLGVAKFEFSGLKLVRAYGTFPHPNLLGAFLILSLACGLWMLLYRKKSKEMIGVVGISSGIATIIIGIFLSYSRSAIATTFVFLIATILSNKSWFAVKYSEVCKKILIHKFFHGGIALVLVFAILFGIYNLLLPRMCLKNCPGDNSIPLRLIYNEKAFAIINSHPFLGIGPGSFVEYAKEHLEKNIEHWEFQPAHNLFLLISSELGLLGLISFFTIIIFQINKNKTNRRKMISNPVLLVFFLFLGLGLFDHYFWTLAQGQYLFWLSLAFFSR